MLEIQRWIGSCGSCHLEEIFNATYYLHCDNTSRAWIIEPLISNKVMNFQRGCEVKDMSAYDVDWTIYVQHCKGMVARRAQWKLTELIKPA